MRFVEQRPFCGCRAAARKLVQIANTVEPVRDIPKVHRDGAAPFP
jgi:hypothetical protein